MEIPDKLPRETNPIGNIPVEKRSKYMEILDNYDEFTEEGKRECFEMILKAYFTNESLYLSYIRSTLPPGLYSHSCFLSDVD